MSLDIGVALAHLTGRTLVPYALRPSWSSAPLVEAERSTVLDLFDVPVPLSTTHTGEERGGIPSARSILSTPVYESVLRLPSSPPAEGADFDAFRNDRPHVATLAAELDDDAIVDVPTLGMYSHFFYLDAPRRIELARVLGKVRPKPLYDALAARIAASLAPFNAVHLRRGDFRYARLSPRGEQIAGEEVAENLATRLSERDRLVVCTDSSSDAGWFAPILRRFRDVVFLDRLILESAEWRGELAALPHRDDSVLALITQMVAARSVRFVGTLFSTFSALIQRARGLAGHELEFLYAYSDWDRGLVPFERCEFVPVQDGPYSWNRVLYPVAPGAFSWFREWPEFSTGASPAPGPRAPPEGTRVLRASDARVHGVHARYEHSDVHDNIGYWTSCDDYVSWELVAESRRRWLVEIRYACPDDCAGSAYRVGLDGGGGLAGTVAATGGWTRFSGWRRLGVLEVPPGRHTLAVRVSAMTAGAVMNLSALRLVPADS